MVRLRKKQQKHLVFCRFYFIIYILKYLYSIFYNMQKVYWRNIYDKLNSL